MYYGADYYPEHWSPDRLAADANLMREAGINVVRMGEFAWSMIEPRPDEFHFEWLDEAVGILAEQGIKTVLGTPTATPPKWVTDSVGGYIVDRYGRERDFGSRRHICANHPGIQWHSRRITAIMTQHYAENQNVVAWQIDNEFGCHDTVRCYCPECRRAFVLWLKEKYGTVEEVNRAWGTVFWSQIYTDWDQIILPAYTACDDTDLNFGHSSGLLLDYCRFSSDSWVRFMEMQLSEIRSFDKLNRPITHNFMGHFSDYDAYDMARNLDFVSWDNYTNTANFKGAAMAHDLMRGLKNQNFWVMEQKSGPCGWSVTGRTPEPGELRLWAWQSVAHGADAIVYFRWRAAVFGAEQYWWGILDHDGLPRRRYREIADIGKELFHASGLLKGAKVCAKAAIIKSYDTLWSHMYQPQSRSFNYFAQLAEYYNAIAAQQVGCDAVSIDDVDLSQYPVVFAPSLNIVTDEQKAKFEEYVQNGGTLVVSFKSGARTDENQMRQDTLPGAFRDAAGVTIEEFDALGDDTLKLKSKTRSLTIPKAECRVFAELLKPVTATALINYADGWRQEYAAVTVNDFGKGKVYYIGCGLTEQVLSKLVNFIFTKVKIAPNVQEASEYVEAILREKNGRHTLVLLNHSEKPGSATIHRDMSDVLTGEKVSGKVALPPYGVRVLV